MRDPKTASPARWTDRSHSHESYVPSIDGPHQNVVRYPDSVNPGLWSASTAESPIRSADHLVVRTAAVHKEWNQHVATPAH